MTRIIKVEPYGKDWRVRSDGIDEMMFHSGAAAEAAARLLADANAKAGQAAEVRIFLRDGCLAGHLPYPVWVSSPAPTHRPNARGLQPA